MISELIRRENLFVQISLPETSTDRPTEQSVMAIFDKVENTKHDAYIDDLGDATLMKTMPKKGKINSTKKLPNFDITEMKLSNGARVLLKPTDFKNDQILFSCYASGGASLYPDGDYHLVDNADQIINNNGLGDFSATRLAKLQQGKMIRISP